jgi:hypothetical protein
MFIAAQPALSEAERAADHDQLFFPSERSEELYEVHGQSQVNFPLSPYPFPLV